MRGLEIRNTTRHPLPPRAAFSRIAKAVVPAWDISLVFVGTTRARALNTQLRKKSYVPNVLSFPLGKRSGEIIICPRTARVEAPQYGMSVPQFILFLFIHGLLHLKGEVHGARMEQCEQELLTKLASFPYGAKNSNRHRHRDAPGARRRR